MLTLNLVSRELKQEIKLRHIYSLLKKMNFVVIIIVIIIAIILLSAKLILQNNFNKVVGQTTLLTGIGGKKYTEEVRGINSRLNIILQIQNERVPWSYLLEVIAGITPDGITLSSLKLNKKNSALKITGNAKTRNDLLKFKNNLENSKIFTAVKSPIKNILQKENINFEFNTKLILKNITPANYE